MPIIKEIELERERELKSLIKENPGSIEPGLKVLVDEFPVENGAVDLLCVDSGKILTIIELKIHEDDSMLLQVVRYYDFISQNINRIAQMYPNEGINDKEEPRLILVAPSFSNTLKKGVKYLDLKFDLVEYNSLVVNKEKAIICHTVDVETPKEIPIQMRVVDHVNYITNRQIKNLCEEIVNKIKGIGEHVEVYARKFYIGFKYRERLFARIKTKRSFFYTMACLAPEWEIDKTRMEEKKDFTEEHFSKIKEAYKSVGGKLNEK